MIARINPSYAHRLLGVQLIPDCARRCARPITPRSRCTAAVAASLPIRRAAVGSFRYYGAGGRFFGRDFSLAGALGGTQFNAVPSLGRVMAGLARGGALLLRG
ncbi:Exported protein [Burkholderia sp. IT-111MI5]